MGRAVAAAGTVSELGAADSLGQLYGNLSAGMVVGGLGHRPVYSGGVLRTGLLYPAIFQGVFSSSGHYPTGPNRKAQGESEHLSKKKGQV